MRQAIAVFFIMAFVGPALAYDLGPTSDLPVKDTPNEPYVTPEVPKQGGDTIADAVVIPDIPFATTGTTAGFLNDYDEVCPYTGSTAPDVVYSYTAASDRVIVIDLCGSSYDTKLYVYDANMNVVGCNDDFYFDDVCGVYVSFIEGLSLIGGMTYYIVVDGYGTSFGDYMLHVFEYEDCDVPCDEDAVPEGEPALHDGYEDLYNGGCSGGMELMQPIDWTNDEDGLPPYDGTAWMCGNSGWFTVPGGGDTRDTDWFLVNALETGTMEATLESEHPCYLFKLAPTDCATVGVELQATGDCELPGTLSFPVTAGEEIWLWVGPTTFTGPVTEFTYFLTVSNNMFDVVPVEEKSFGQVKALYR